MTTDKPPSISPNAARTYLVLMCIAFSALPAWLFFLIDGNDPLNLLARAALLAIIAYNVKVLVNGLQRVSQVEITSIIQCLPWRLAAAKRRNGARR